jgi:hypothetical protein
MASVAAMKAKSEALRASMPEDPQGGTAAHSPVKKASSRSNVAARSHRRLGDAVQLDAAQLASDYETVRHRYEDVLKENETLKGEQKRRMESYMRRETNYQAEIEDLKAELERQSKARPPEDERMLRLRSEHQKVIDRLDSQKIREQHSLQEQEKDLLRAFRARLWDVQFELETERSKKDDGALEWIEKTKTLGKELDWSRDEALRLDRMNQFLSKENAKLKTQLRSQEDDREFIVRQMLALKKENSRLKAQSESEGELGGAASGGSLGGGGGGGDGGHGVARAASAGVRGTAPGSAGKGLSRPMTAGAAAFRAMEDADGGDGALGGTLAASERVKELMLQQAESEERYREVVARLKRLLDVERRNLRAVRAAHAKDLQSRTELETLLRACVDDVRKEVSAQRSGASSPSKLGAPPAGSSARAVGVEDLGPKERERVLELLLSQERVVALLYERTFPPRADTDDMPPTEIPGGPEDDGGDAESP